jgi:hypothetical protein
MLVAAIIIVLAASKIPAVTNLHLPKRIIVCLPGGRRFPGLRASRGSLRHRVVVPSYFKPKKQRASNNCGLKDFELSWIHSDQCLPECSPPLFSRMTG